jgi:hypothetical protein
MKNINIPFQMNGGKNIIKVNNSSIFNFIKKLFIKNKTNNKLSFVKGSSTKEYYKKLKFK